MILRMTEVNRALAHCIECLFYCFSSRSLETHLCFGCRNFKFIQRVSLIHGQIPVAKFICSAVLGHLVFLLIQCAGSVKNLGYLEVLASSIYLNGLLVWILRRQELKEVVLADTGKMSRWIHVTYYRRIDGIVWCYAFLPSLFFSYRT